MNLYKSMVCPNLEYCSTAWVLTMWKMLEKVQHQFTHMFTHLKKLPYEVTQTWRTWTVVTWLKRGETEQTLQKCSKWWSNCRLFHGIDSVKGLRILLHVDTLGNWWRFAVIVIFTSSLSEWSTTGTVCHKISTQLLLTALRTVWSSEENVRWTYSKTECLQVLWLTTVLDLSRMFGDLDDGGVTKYCSGPLGSFLGNNFT